MFKRAANPFWVPHNLKKHFKKRFAKDSHCWEALTNTKNFTNAIYEAQSKKIISTCWLCFKAKKYAPKEKKYYRLSKYHTDIKIATTITDIKTDEIITCYHEHHGKQCTLSSGSSKILGAEDQIEHIRQLKYELKCGIFKQVAVGNPAQTPASGIQMKINELIAS